MTMNSRDRARRSGSIFRVRLVRFSARWVAVAAAGGCGRCPPLADAPILPADVTHAPIRAGLVAADAEFVPEVCVDHVRVGELGGGHYGKYAPLGRSVRLAPYLSGKWLDEVLRHELCHAVDRQNDLVRGREDQFTDAWSIDWTDGGERREAAEGFAHVCELGRDALAALWQPTCPGDPDLRAARVVRDEVYGVGADRHRAHGSSRSRRPRGRPTPGARW